MLVLGFGAGVGTTSTCFHTLPKVFLANSRRLGKRRGISVADQKRPTGGVFAASATRGGGKKAVVSLSGSRPAVAKKKKAAELKKTDLKERVDQRLYHRGRLKNKLALGVR